MKNTKRFIFCSVTCLFFLIAGYMLGKLHTQNVHNYEQADNAVADLHQNYLALKFLTKNQLKDAKELLAAQAEMDLSKIINYGNIVDRPGHAEYRSVLLREYGKFRKANSSLYQPPSYLNAEELGEWKKIENRFQRFLEDNSAAEGVLLKQNK